MALGCAHVLLGQIVIDPGDEGNGIDPTVYNYGDDMPESGLSQPVDSTSVGAEIGRVGAILMTIVIGIQVAFALTEKLRLRLLWAIQGKVEGFKRHAEDGASIVFNGTRRLAMRADQGRGWSSRAFKWSDRAAWWWHGQKTRNRLVRAEDKSYGHARRVMGARKAGRMMPQAAGRYRARNGRGRRSGW